MSDTLDQQLAAAILKSMQRWGAYGNPRYHVEAVLAVFRDAPPDTCACCRRS